MSRSGPTARPDPIAWHHHLLYTGRGIRGLVSDFLHRYRLARLVKPSAVTSTFAPQSVRREATEGAA